MAARYAPERLKQLRELCSTRLQPASTVQAMFLYELERERENESLFHDQMFRAARIEDVSNITNERIAKMERIFKTCADAHGDERTVSPAGVIAIYEGMDARVRDLHPEDDPQAVLKVAGWLADELDQEAKTVSEQVALPAILLAIRIGRAEASLQSRIEALDVNRTAADTDFAELKNRTAKLEDLVRVLTAQRSMVGTPSPMESPRMAQRLPVTASDGQTLDLSIPKGTSFVPLREHRAASATRTASPSKSASGLATTSATVPSASSASAQPQQKQPVSAVDQWGGLTSFDDKPLPPPPAAKDTFKAEKAHEPAAAPVKAAPTSETWIPKATPKPEPKAPAPSPPTLAWDAKPIKPEPSNTSWEIAPKSSTHVPPPASVAVSYGPPATSGSTSAADTAFKGPVQTSKPQSVTSSSFSPLPASAFPSATETTTLKTPIQTSKPQATTGSKGKVKKWTGPPLFNASAAKFADAMHVTDHKEEPVTSPQPSAVAVDKPATTLSFANSTTSATSTEGSKAKPIDPPSSNAATVDVKPTSTASSGEKHQTRTASSMKQQIGNYITSASPKATSQSSTTVPRISAETRSSKPAITFSPPSAAASEKETHDPKKAQKSAEPDRLPVPKSSKPTLASITGSNANKASGPAMWDFAGDLAKSKAAKANGNENIAAPTAKNKPGLSAAAAVFSPAPTPSVMKRLAPGMDAAFKAQMVASRAAGDGV